MVLSMFMQDRGHSSDSDCKIAGLNGAGVLGEATNFVLSVKVMVSSMFRQERWHNADSGCETGVLNGAGVLGEAANLVLIEVTVLSLSEGDTII